MNRELKNLLQCLELDIAYQINSLNSSCDISWDCYDVKNWKASHETVLKIAKLLEIKIKNNEEKNNE